ncbi:hypothetical protein ACFQL0_04005 [Haloplanus litoreus]
MNSDWGRRLTTGTLVGMVVAARPAAGHVDYVTEGGDGGRASSTS